MLRAAKQAFKFIRNHEVGPETERQELLGQLRDVIDRADPPSFDEDDSSLNLVMTNPTADAILAIFQERASSSQEDVDVLEAVNEGLRRTKQRAYLRLDLNHVILRRLHFVLCYTNSPAQVASFKRLVKAIEKGLDKNPMEILGRLGL